MKSLRPIPSTSLDPRAALLFKGPRWVPRLGRRPSISSPPAPGPRQTMPALLLAPSPPPSEPTSPVIYRCRFLTIFGVVGSLMGSVLCFLKGRPKWLEIQSVNELKTKLGHVIVMFLLAGLFEKSREVTISSSIDLFCFAASILLSSSYLYFLSKLQSSKQSKDT